VEIKVTTFVDMVSWLELGDELTVHGNDESASIEAPPTPRGWVRGGDVPVHARWRYLGGGYAPFI